MQAADNASRALQRMDESLQGGHIQMAGRGQRAERKKWLEQRIHMAVSTPELAILVDDARQQFDDVIESE